MRDENMDYLIVCKKFRSQVLVGRFGDKLDFWEFRDKFWLRC